MNTSATAAPDAHEPVAVEDTVWGARLPFTRPLGEFDHGLSLALGRGRRALQDGLPVAAVHFRLPGAIVQRYGGALAPAIQMVAVDQRSGQVFAAALMDQDDLPTRLNLPGHAQPDPQEPSVGGYVAADLDTLLGLPAAAANYRIFAWLDEWHSEVLPLELPARRRSTRAGLPANQPPRALTGPMPSPHPQGASARLFAAGEKLRGLWSSVESGPAVLLGLDLDLRRARWETLADAASPLAKAGLVELLPDQFMGSAPQPRTFALSVGNLLATVVL